MINAKNPTPESKGDYAKCLDRYWLHASPNDVIGRALRTKGIWEPEVTRWLVNNIIPGSTCLDIGMNNGYYTELLAYLAGPDGQVISFEPRHDAIDRYLDAMQMNNYDDNADTEIHEIALSDHDGRASIRTLSSNEGASTLNDRFHFNVSPMDRVTTSSVKVSRLDSVLDVHVDFIKIDIEGSEPKAFAGFGPNVRQCPQIITELHPSHSPEFMDFLLDEYHVNTFAGTAYTMQQFEQLRFGHVTNVILTKR